MGDNATVHRFVLNYYAFQKVNTRLFDAVKVCVFVVSLQEGRNDLARYLAVHDPWYQRHVHSAFAGGLKLTPRFDCLQRERQDIIEELNFRDVLPVAKLQSLLQDYTRMATQEVPVCLFECQCWLPNGSAAIMQTASQRVISRNANGDRTNGNENDAPPDLRMPFLMSAQVGFLVDVALFQRVRAQVTRGAVDGGAAGPSNSTCRRSSIRDVLKDPNFSNSHLPYEPKTLIVASHAPTIVEHGKSGRLGVDSSVASERRGVRGDDGEAGSLERGGAGQARGGEPALERGGNGSNESEVIEEAGPKGYTTLLFTNVPARLSDEVLADDLDDAEKAKVIAADSRFSSAPTHPDLKMHVREWGGRSKEILAQKNLKKSSFGGGSDPVDALLSSLREDIRGADATPKTVGIVAIEANNSKDVFGIMLDGVVHGPFRKVTISPLLRQGDAVPLTVPFMAFLPPTS